MSARVLFIGDPHIKSNDIIRSRIMCEDIIKIAKEELPDQIVIMGDTLHNHNEYTAEPHTQAILFIGELSKIAHVVLLIGNHDIPGPNYYLTHLHPFLAFRYCEEVTLVDQALTPIDIKGMNFLGVPFIPEGRFSEAMNECEMDDEPIAIFAHNEFAIEGIPHYRIRDYWPEDGPLIIAGHIHDYRWPQKNVCYVGTPRQIDVNEDIYKTVSLFTFERNGKYNERRIQVITPPKVEYRIKFGDIPNWNPTIAQCKIIITGTIPETITAKKHPSVVKWRKEGATIRYDAVSVELSIEERECMLKNIMNEEQRVSFRSQYEAKIADDPIMMEIYKKIRY